ncbi:hypothetical protein M3I53_26370 [Paraburkholderia sp. CNPSo 3272]|uniref:hypothetical protein n=1 Tax=Paraburkholderia sp. CNPSo 3272 TaxID=2940931 RepID=UPI0020B8B738|nr:hypothetical protein [Paraburkholderia sp. CNPSo 3272]MCP3726615.1 hypothetical protein [Paraburkholderia sp. CNPSo 3272]
MNNRHIQTFLTVSAAFFAMSAPLHSNASTKSAESATTRCAQYTLSMKADTNAMPAAKAERKS